jgi:hypothetical protein
MYFNYVTTDVGSCGSTGLRRYATSRKVAGSRPDEVNDLY